MRGGLGKIPSKEEVLLLAEPFEMGSYLSEYQAPHPPQEGGYSAEIDQLRQGGSMRCLMEGCELFGYI